jgi:hypothetical protein
MNEREWHDEAMRLARDCGDIERRACIGKAQGFDVRNAYEALAAHLRTRPSAEPLPVAQGESISQQYLREQVAADMAPVYAAFSEPVAQGEREAWSDAKLRGIASDYFTDKADWPKAMLCMRHLLMEQAARATAPSAAQPAQVEQMREALEAACGAFSAAEPYLPNGCDAEFTFYASWEDVKRALDAALSTTPQPAASVAPMVRGLSSEEIQELVKDSDLDWHRGWGVVEGENRFAVFARAVLAAAGKEKP